MGRDRFVGRHQLFQRGVAGYPQPRLAPERAQRAEQLRPAARHQRLPQRLGRGQQRAALVQQGDGVAHRAARGAHAVARDLGRLQRVQAPLGLRKGQPRQTVEEVVQVVARGHGTFGEHELLIRHAGRQRGLRHEAHRCRTLGHRVQRPGHASARVPARQRRLAPAAHGLPPGLLPVDGRCGLCGGNGWSELRGARHATMVPQRPGPQRGCPQAVAHPSATWRVVPIQ